MIRMKKAANDNTPTFFGKLRKWFVYSSAVSALTRLDDRTLKDIGIKRSEIHNFVRSWSDQNDDAA